MKNFSNFTGKFITESKLGDNLVNLKPVTSKGALYKLKALNYIKENAITIHFISNLVNEGYSSEDTAVKSFAETLVGKINENEKAFRLGYLYQSVMDSNEPLVESLRNDIDSVIMEGEDSIGVSVMVGDLSKFKNYYNDLKIIESKIIETNAQNMRNIETDKFSIETPMSYVHETEKGDIVRVLDNVYLVGESGISLTNVPSQEFINLSESAKNINYNVEKGFASVKTALGELVLENGVISKKDGEEIVECDKTELINEFAYSISNLKIEESEMTKLDKMIAISENKDSFKALKNFKVVTNHLTNESALIASNNGFIVGGVISSERSLKEHKNFTSITEAVEYTKQVIGIDASSVFESEMKDEKDKEDAIKSKLEECDAEMSKLEEKRKVVLEGIETTTKGSEANNMYIDLDAKIGEGMVALSKKRKAILEGEDDSMSMEDRLKVWDKLKKGDTLNVTVKGGDVLKMKVGALKENKAKTMKYMSLKDLDNPKGVKYRLDNSNGKITMAKGDMSGNLMSLSLNESIGDMTQDDYDKKDEEVTEGFKEGKVIVYKETKDGDGDKFTPYIKYRESSKDFEANFGYQTEYSKKLKDLKDEMNGAGFKVDKVLQESVNEAKGDKEAYQKFFNSMLKKFNVTEPDQLKGDEKKKFFDAVDKGWKSDKEEGGVNEAKTYNYSYKKDALNDYFKGKLTSKELNMVARDIFGTEIATKHELKSFLDNKFTQGVMSDTYGIDEKTLVKKVKDLIKVIVESDDINESKKIKFELHDQEVRFSDGSVVDIHPMDGSFKYKGIGVEIDASSEDSDIINKDVAKQLNNNKKGLTFVYESKGGYKPTKPTEDDKKFFKENKKAIMKLVDADMFLPIIEAINIVRDGKPSDAWTKSVKDWNSKQVSETEKETPTDSIDSDEEESKKGEEGAEKDKSDVDVEESVKMASRYDNVLLTEGEDGFNYPTTKKGFKESVSRMRRVHDDPNTDPKKKAKIKKWLAGAKKHKSTITESKDDGISVVSSLMELWFAVHESDTDKYSKIASKLDSKGISMKLQNEVSDSATKMRRKKAIDVSEVNNIVTKIVKSSGMDLNESKETKSLYNVGDKVYFLPSLTGMNKKKGLIIQDKKWHKAESIFGEKTEFMWWYSFEDSYLSAREEELTDDFKNVKYK